MGEKRKRQKEEKTKGGKERKEEKTKSGKRKK